MSIETTKEITEVRIISALSKTLVTKYNWSLVVTTMLIVTACYKLFFYNNNFDVYIMLFSVGSIVASYLKQNRSSNNNIVGRYGVLNSVLSIIGLIALKNLWLQERGYYIRDAQYNICVFVIATLNIFMFLLLVKHVLLQFSQE